MRILKYILRLHLFTLLAILLIGTSCNGSDKKDVTNGEEHPKLKKGLGNGNVQCSMKDNEGNLWFGTSQNGLFQYDGKSFRQYGVTHGLNSNNIFCVMEDGDGTLWIGTDSGMCRYDGTTFTQIEIPVPKNFFPEKNAEIRNTRRVTSIIQVRDGKLWIASMNGVHIYDGRSFTPFILRDSTGGIVKSEYTIEHLLEDKGGNIWFGGRTTEGVYRYDGTSTRHFTLQELTLQFGTRNVIHQWGWPQVQDKDGNIWFSNWAGAYRFDGTTFTSFSLHNGLTGHNGLVAKIIEDSNGNMFFGGDAGLTRYDGTSFTNFQDGLLNPWIWTIVRDTTGNLWVGTRGTGLYRFDGKTFHDYTE